MFEQLQCTPFAYFIRLVFNIIMSDIEEGRSLRVKICPKARSPKVNRPPSKYLHKRCKINCKAVTDCLDYNVLCIKQQSYNFSLDL